MTKLNDDYILGLDIGTNSCLVNLTSGYLSVLDGC